VGEMKNSGVEFSANYNMKAGPIDLGFNGNLTLLKNKVTKLYHGINLGDTYEGFSFGYIRGFKVGGIFQTQAEIDEWRLRYRDNIAGQSATNPTQVLIVPATCGSGM
jgi:outer membrane receptor protein involved in Fe transport